MGLPLPSGFKSKYGTLLFEGLPYRGEVYDRKEADPIEKQPVQAREVHIRQFLTSSEEDMKAWTQVLQKVADGVCVVSFEEKQYDPEVKAWRVLLRWYDIFYTNPEGVVK